MKADFTADINQRLRKLANLDTLEIPDLFQLGRMEPAPSRIGEHSHSGLFEIAYYAEGFQTYLLHGKRHEVQRGEFILLPPNLPHTLEPPKGGKSMLYYLLFRCMPDTRHFMGLEDDLADYIRDSLYAADGCVFLGGSGVRDLLEQMLQMYFSKSPFREARIHYLAIEFFYQVIHRIERHEHSREIPENIRNILRYIESLPMECFSVEDLAALASMPLNQFRRKFKEYTGYTPNLYMVRRKLLLSQEMLRETHIPAAEIAAKLGFSTSQHFSTVFKRCCGMTPNEYRKKYQAE